MQASCQASSQCTTTSCSGDYPPAFKPGEPLLGQVGFLGEHYKEWLRTPVSGQPRFFRSDYLEGITKVQWWLVPAIWGPVVMGAVVSSFWAPQHGVITIAAVFATGILFWFWMEYSIHRFLFHIEPRGRCAITLHFTFHGCHHKFPWDKERLVFPPIPAAVIVAAVYYSTRAWVPQGLGLPMFAGIVAGYLSYDCIHYGIHHGGLPRLPWLVQLRRAHLNHHFRDPNRCYGISNSLFDVLLGTCTVERPVSRASHCEITAG